MHARLLSLYVLLFFSLFILFLKPAHVYAEGDKPYLSQEYVDTMVQNAFYGFVEAAEFGGTEMLQTRAIDRAKKVAEELKKLAVGDPNRRYVLWRVSELEQQIYYEEEELLLKKMYKNQKAINVLCNKFNEEVGKKRPNFGNLIAIHSSMLNLDPHKADELAWLIEDRDRNISREVSFACERYLLFGAYDNAKKEFEYIKKNRKYLFIPDGTFESFENRIHKKIEADDMVANIETYYRDIIAEINKTNIGKARHGIAFFEDRLQRVHTMLPYKKYSQFRKKLNGFSEMIAQKEDSLVYQNMTLIHENKIDEAIDYMDNVLRKRGVSNEKIAMVDKTIMVLPGRKRVSATDKSVDRELLALTSTSEDNNGFSFGDVAAKMKAKMDSVQAYEAEQRRLAQIQWEKEHKREIAAKLREEKKEKKYRDKAKKDMLKIYILLEDNKIDKAYSKFQELQASIKKYTSEGEFKGLEIAVVQSYEAEKNRERKMAENKRKAKTVTSEIYSMLDQRNIEGAYSKFNNLKTLLQKYSSDDDFMNLQTSVTQAYQSFAMQRAQKKTVKKETEMARADQTPQTIQPVRTTQEPKATQTKPVTKPAPTIIAAEPTEPKAKPKNVVHTAEPVRAPEKPKANQVAVVKQEEKITKQEPSQAPVTSISSVNKRGDDPYAAFDKKQQEAQGKATQDVIDIYTLLESNQVRLAYEYFKKNQIPLKTYVSKEVYDVLESTVLQAYKGLTASYE